MKKNPQAPLKLNLNPIPSTKPYRKGGEREMGEIITPGRRKIVWGSLTS